VAALREGPVSAPVDGAFHMPAGTLNRLWARALLMMRSRSLPTPPKTEYYRLAEQFEQLAASAGYEPERRGLKARAVLFRRLGDARLAADDAARRFRPNEKVKAFRK